MPERLSDNVWKHLICSSCGHSLEAESRGAFCRSCGLIYSYTESGSLDLRLQRPKTFTDNFELGTPLLPEGGFPFEPLQPNPDPQVDFSGVQTPRHLTKETLSYFPRAKSKNSLMLDLGCGKAVHKEVAEQAGFEWVGLDYEAPEAPILGDAQALPFEDNTFDFILCVTVIQYVRFPFVMIREANRVLKPNGKLIGTLAFLEPSHGTSFYHHTHLGTYNLLKHGGFMVEKLTPSKEWTVLRALASMGMFYRMPRWMAQTIVLPLELFHRVWWRAGELISRKSLENLRVRHFTGSFTFIASKPEN
jgi:SAM-dependent methyltransferase